MSPFTCDLTRSELLDLLSDCAERAERLRRGGANLVLLTGSELALTTIGFLPGESIGDRFALLSQPHRLREVLPAVPGPINDFLGQAVEVVRARFGGMVSYASMPFERVDWTPFDVVSSDAGYRSVEIADRYRDGLRALTALGKPVAITEFGCTTYRGAADKGAHGNMVIEWGADGRPVGLKGELIRDEDEQAACLRELLDILEEEAVESAFVNTFARYDLPSHPRLPRRLRHGQLRGRQGARGGHRRHVRRDALGTQGRVQCLGRPLRRLSERLPHGRETVV